MPPMRDNGLGAAAFTPLADVEAGVVDDALEVLRDAGVAAYAAPVPPGDDADRLRIFVDSTRIAAGRTALAPVVPGLAAGLDPDPAAARRADLTIEEVDANWAALVAGFESPGDTGGAEGPDDPAAPTRGLDPGSGLSARLVRAGEGGAPASPGPRDYSLPDDADEEGFTPPPPPPLPRPRHAADRLAWAGAIGGPILLVGSHVLGTPGWIGGVGIIAFGAGFVTLVARMRTERDDDSDGAVI